MSNDDSAADREAAQRANIRALNDRLRRQFDGGRIMMTAGVSALAPETQRAVFRKIQEFDAFSEENDPWNEHDFVSVEHDGMTFFAKIDYYDCDLQGLSEDPADPEKTRRVMTIMLADEY